MKHYVYDDNFEMIEVPQNIKNDIIREYMSNKYYITVAILMGIIGFLLGVTV